MHEALRGRSKDLFGHSYMLEVCLLIGEPGDSVTLSDLALRGNVGSASLYSVPIQRLKRLGLLVPTSGGGADRRAKPLARTESLLWSAARELAERA